MNRQLPITVRVVLCISISFISQMVAISFSYAKDLMTDKDTISLVANQSPPALVDEHIFQGNFGWDQSLWNELSEKKDKNYERSKGKVYIEWKSKYNTGVCRDYIGNINELGGVYLYGCPQIPFKNRNKKNTKFKAINWVDIDPIENIEIIKAYFVENTIATPWKRQKFSDSEHEWKRAALVIRKMLFENGAIILQRSIIDFFNDGNAVTVYRMAFPLGQQCLLPDGTLDTFWRYFITEKSGIKNIFNTMLSGGGRDLFIYGDKPYFASIAGISTFVKSNDRIYTDAGWKTICSFSRKK